MAYLGTSGMVWIAAWLAILVAPVLLLWIIPCLLRRFFGLGGGIVGLVLGAVFVAAMGYVVSIAHQQDCDLVTGDETVCEIGITLHLMIISLYVLSFFVSPLVFMADYRRVAGRGDRQISF